MPLGPTVGTVAKPSVREVSEGFTTPSGNGAIHALAVANPREIKSQGSDPFRGKASGDSARGKHVLGAGETVGKERISRYRPSRTVQSCIQRLAFPVLETDPDGLD